MQECSNGKERKCKEPCNANSLWSCEDACPFDLEALGDCKEMPYGFVNNPGEEGFINPCFFLHFDLIEYWKPELPENIPHDIPRTQRSNIQEGQWDGVPVAFDCKAKLVKEELSLFAQIKEQMNKPVIHQILPYPSMDLITELETFANDKELFDTIEKFGENIDKFFETFDHLRSYKEEKETLKMLVEFKKHIDMFAEDKQHSELFSEFKDLLYMDKYDLVGVIRVKNDLNKLEKKQQDVLLAAIAVIPIINTEQNIKDAQIHVCINTLGFSEDSHPHRLCCDIVEMMLQSGNLDMIVKYDKMKKHLGHLEEKLIDQNMFKEIQEHLEIFADSHDYGQVKKYLKMFAEDKQLLEKIVENWEYVFTFKTVKKYIAEYNEYKTNIDMTFFPNTQGIPMKYFPLSGNDYEPPLLAVKLNWNKLE